MDVSLVVRRRLEELRLEQRDLARAAGVTESYVSQLLTGKKAPPSPGRTDIYDRMDRFLKLPPGELARLARLQRKQQLKRELGDEPAPLYHAVRELVLRKCSADRAPHVRAIFEQQPFGELERLVTQTLLDVAQRVAKAELQVAPLSGQSDEATRVSVLEFLDTDVFHLSTESSVAFLDPLIQSWDIDLATFSLEIILNHSIVPGRARRFEFVEREALPPEPGLEKFLHDPSLSASATPEEVAFLTRLTFAHKRPTAFYYYRELQSLRDPLHFSLTP